MEIRVDYLKSETVVYSRKRSKRPHNYNINKSKVQSGDFPCPFCLENNNLIEETICENILGSRIVKNLYPVVDGEFGAHDVAIESVKHDLALKDMSLEVVTEFLVLLQERCIALKKMELIKNIQIFKNSGPISGATLEHSHWQIVSTSFIPHKTQTISDNFTSYRKETESCFLCNENDIIKLKENENVVMGVPKAGCGNLNLRLFPKRHVTNFIELSKAELNSIAEYIINAANTIYRLEESSSFNILFFSNPEGNNNKDFHFFIDILDRKGTFGGFELATGDFINSVLPEEMYQKIINVMEV